MIEHEELFTMALDGLVVHALTRELQMLTGGKIHKIHQPNAHDIIMQVRSQGATHRLLLSANPTYPRMHLTTQSYMNPLEAPMFCMLLRKHCESGVIQSIEQIGNERIIHIQLQQRDELGDQRMKTIIMELTGRHSNIILIDPDTNLIMDGIHHVTPAISSYRIVMPGSAYTSPPDQQKADPFHIESRAMEAIIRTGIEQHEDAFASLAKRVEHALVAGFSGISPLAAREFVARCQFEDHALSEVISQLAESVSLAIRALREGKPTPNIVTPASGKSVFSVIDLQHVQGERQQWDTVNACLEGFYGDKAERDTVKQRVSDLIKLLQNERSKNVTKLQKLADTIEDAQDADRYRILGELLTASLHLAAKGDREIEVLNYYDEAQAMIKITLDPLLSPADNAQRYFKRYSKMKNSITIIQEQIESAREEIHYLDNVLQQLGRAAMTDIEEIREELIEQGYVKRRGKQPKKRRKNERPALTCYTSSEDVPIYVGKNNTQNEYLTNRIASASDTWLHTKDIPGSHVVIRGAFGEQTLLEAAMLAAYYSQARDTSQVPVDYTLIRHVRKPSGAKPGFVIYDKQRTLYVTPDEARLKSLKQEMKS